MKIFRTEIGDGSVARRSDNKPYLPTAATDDLEYACWKLFLQYADAMGITIRDENGDLATTENDAIDFCIAKDIQDHILDMFIAAGFDIQFDKTI